MADVEQLRRHHRAIELTERARRIATSAAANATGQDDGVRACGGKVFGKLDPRFRLAGDAAEDLGIPVHVLSSLRHRGMITAVRARNGTSWIYDVDEVARFARALDEDPELAAIVDHFIARVR